MKEFKYLHRKPTNIISNGSKKDYKRPVSPIFVLEGYSIVAAITNGTLTGAGKIIEGGEAEVTIVPSEGYVLPSSISEVTVTAECPADVDPILENNSWDTIRAVCEAGNAANYWAVGDTKNVTGGDSSVRPVAIVDMSGLYGKHVVFQYKALSNDTYVWDAGGVNDYSECDLIAKLDVGGDIYVAMVDAGLNTNLTATTVKVAKGGNDGTLVDVTQKLFLPAEKELGGSSYSRAEEQAALTTFAYWSTHSSASDRILKSPNDNTAHGWWERSPRSGNADVACFVYSIGDFSYDGVTNGGRVAPCFAF